MNRWIYWRNIGLCSSCRSLYRLLNYIGWKPEELSPVLYINLSVAKNFPFYVQDIWKVRSCKTCISTLLTINLQTKTHHTHPKLLKLCLHVKRETAAALLSFSEVWRVVNWRLTSYRHTTNECLQLEGKDDDELVKLRYHWNDSRWHKRGTQFCKFTFTWFLFPGSSI